MMISAKIAIIPTVNPTISCKKKFNTEKKNILRWAYGE